MNYARIIKADLINGPGIGTTLFVSGCNFKCPGCYNEAAWDLNYGTKFTLDTLEEFLESINEDYIDHVSILGGEPLLHAAELTHILRIIKEFYPDKKVWIWTGFKFQGTIKRLEIFNYVDVVIDGTYKQELPTTKLYRGSDNQRMFIKEENKWVRLD